jgi:SpoVK/Ycf46/Vps4 family AAA+-type ATPase
MRRGPVGGGRKPAAGARKPWNNDFAPGALADHSNDGGAGRYESGQVGLLTLDPSPKTELDKAPAEIRLMQGTIKVGRDPKKANEVFTSNAVSGMHCELNVKSSGAVTIEDCKSTNGTYVNDFKIKSPTSISDGDTICFGTPDYRYRVAIKKGGSAPGGARRPSSDNPKPPAANKPLGNNRRGSAQGNDRNAAKNAKPGWQGAGNNNSEPLDPDATLRPQKCYVGDRVNILSGPKRAGLVMYVGPADFANGQTVVGVKLDEKRSTSDCDGKQKGERYFRCMAGYGLYVPLDDVSVIEPDAGPEKDENFDLEVELAKLVGLPEVKEALRSMLRGVEVQKRRAEFGVKAERSMHMVFVGNPGTGKTLVARMLGRMLLNMDVLERGHLVEVSRKDLVAAYSGETAKNVSAAVERATGGVLFVDEAYTLKHEGSTDSHGQECIDTLLKEMDDRKDFVVVLAGYGKEMASLLNTNPGLSSRFPTTFTFSDYSVPEMAQIASSIILEKGFKLASDLNTDVITDFISQNVRPSEIAKGNGRLAKTLVEQAIERQTDRVFKSETMSRDSLTTIQLADFAAPEAAGAEDGAPTVEKALKELDNIVGMAGVKEHVVSLRAQLQLNKERKEAGLTAASGCDSLHMIFTGNPGTGKTTVARIVADLLRAMGILNRGHLIETDRSGLVAGYSGQTALKTKSVVESALGGVLFVDEAYALVQQDKDSFGKEALDTLIKMVEDHRDNLVVILAGYSGDMATMVAQNPGVRSRFPTNIDFADYSPDELLQIATLMVEKVGLALSDGAQDVLLARCTAIATNGGRQNGNGRDVRNLVEASKRLQALRLLKVEGKKTPQQLITLEASDFEDK